MTGAWPPAHIDHVNFDKTDNQWYNLRASTKAQNGMNRGLSARNKSGFKGVSWSKSCSKWEASIRVDGRKKNLGYFDNPVHAACAYHAAALLHFGKFAPEA